MVSALLLFTAISASGSASGSSALGMLPAGRAALEPQFANKVRMLSPAEQGLVVKAARPMLRFPDTARFRFLGWNGAVDYCGEVNAQMRNGQYAGYVLFSVHVRQAKGRIVAADRPVLMINFDPVVTRGLEIICRLSTK